MLSPVENSHEETAERFSEGLQSVPRSVSTVIQSVPRKEVCPPPYRECPWKHTISSSRLYKATMYDKSESLSESYRLAHNLYILHQGTGWICLSSASLSVRFIFPKVRNGAEGGLSIGQDLPFQHF